MQIDLIKNIFLIYSQLKNEIFVYREDNIHTLTKSTLLLANLTDPVIGAGIDCDILTPNIAVNTL